MAQFISDLNGKALYASSLLEKMPDFKRAGWKSRFFERCRFFGGQKNRKARFCAPQRTEFFIPKAAVCRYNKRQKRTFVKTKTTAFRLRRTENRRTAKQKENDHE
uniref:hypothetical protein n=1 Tax=Gemmiger formicilis TaxID=745368 RepID=UPI003FEE70D5